MSTPISPNNKLKGPALYAPRHLRERALSEDRAAIAETSAQAEAGQSETGQVDREPRAREQIATAEDTEGRDETDATDALDWLDQTIRAVIALQHGANASATSDPPVAGSQSASIAPSQDDRDAWPPSASAVGRQTHASAQVGRPFHSRPEHGADASATSDPLVAGLQSAFIAPSQDDRDAWPPSASAAGRQTDASARVARPLHSRLEPEIVPAPPAESGRFQQCIRILLVIIFAAAVAYGLTMISTSPPDAIKGATDRIAGAASQPKEVQAKSPPASRLIVGDQQVFANEPLSLAIRVEHAMENESLLLDGFAEGTTLSAGTATSPSSWQLPYDKLGGLYLYAPKDFVGVMNTAVDLLGRDKRVLDSRTMQLKWIARPMPAPTTASVEPIDAGEAAILMQKGRDFLGSGDISAARVAFRRLADAGNADAALALARTYDPDYLAANNFLGVRGDRETAHALYQRAKELASSPSPILYGAIAFSQGTGAYGYSYDAGSRGSVEEAALTRCGGSCSVVLWFKNACGALAAGDSHGFGTGWAGDRSRAEEIAMSNCAKSTNDCKLLASTCTTH
jgi:hypothetical protein